MDIVKRLEAATFDKDNFPRMDSERQVQVGLAKEAKAEIERLRADMAQIERIANIPPADDSFGSLAVRMGKVWLLARANSVKQ
jgi:hypothetical protein